MKWIYAGIGVLTLIGYLFLEGSNKDSLIVVIAWNGIMFGIEEIKEEIRKTK